MAFPDKMYGFRRITVDSLVYRWRLNIGYLSSTLTVLCEQEYRSKLTVLLPSFGDIWIHYPTAIKNDPHIITPVFVERAIRAALNERWSPNSSAEKLTLKYSDQSFKLDNV